MRGIVQRLYSTAPRSLNIGGTFQLTAEQAQTSFQTWALGFVPGKVKFKSIQPTLIPFVSTPTNTCLYAGFQFTDNLVDAVKIDSHHWLKSVKLSMTNPSILLDPISPLYEVHPNKTLLPAYQIQFTHFMFSYQVFVGAQNGKVSGLRLFSIGNGLAEAIRFSFSQDSVIPSIVKFVVFLWWPWLIPLWISSASSYAVFRAWLSPRFAFSMDKFVSLTPPSWKSKALVALIQSQYATFDPQSDVFQLRAKMQAAQFLHDLLHNQETVGQRQHSAREQEDFLRDLFRFQSTQARQQQFFYRAQEEFKRQQEEGQQNRRSHQRQQQQREDYQHFFSPSKAKQRDLYALLGITKQATMEEIREGYRKQLMKFHPDHFKGDAEVAKQTTQDIIDAYRTLKDPKKKREYDDAL